MTTDSERHAVAPERLSALMDGELDAGTVVHACAHWREDVRARADWHAYHLIGDVLRADDLACDPAHDAAFLAAFRARLATEPVVLAPQASATVVHERVGNGSRWSWMAPTAVAAGFVAVAGVVMLTRLPGPAAAPTLAQATPVLAVTPQAVTASALAGPVITEPVAGVVPGDKMIRDARLQRYLDAHNQFAGSSALGVPSAFLRSATAAGPSDR